MGITKRRKQPVLFREGARHAAQDASAMDTARPSVQHAAVASLIAHGKWLTGDSTDEPTTSDDSDHQSQSRLDGESGQQGDSEQKQL